MIYEFLNEVFWNNSMKEYLIAMGILILSFVVFRLLNLYAVNRIKSNISKKPKTPLTGVFTTFLNGIHWIFYLFLSLYIAIQFIILPNLARDIFYYALIILAGFFIGKGLSKAIERFIKNQIERRTDKKPENTSIMKLFGTLAKIVVWIIVVLMLLSNLGVEITPLIAGLGIGGIAIALALQSILGDLFSAFVIYFDKPFREGDFIIIGNDLGTVKNIGIKSTRIETLQGQELVVSNKELTDTRINNYKRMEKRRVQFRFGVEYGTSATKLQKINKIVKEVVNKVKDTELDRVHFKEFGNSSLIYEVVYYVDSSDYNKYMDVQEEINMGIYKRFEKEGITFAFPTQTIHMKEDKKK